MKSVVTVLQTIKEVVQRKAPGASLILFGSYARGEQTEESDIDLLILTDDTSRTNERALTSALYDIELSSGILISPHIYSRLAWATHRVTPFFENVNREGKLL